MYKVHAWAVSKEGHEIGGGIVGKYKSKDLAIKKVLTYLVRSIKAGGQVSGSIKNGFKFEEPNYDMADGTITIE